MKNNKHTNYNFLNFDKGINTYSGKENIQFHRHDHNLAVSNHRHDFFEFFFVEEDSYTMIINGESIHLEENQLILFNPYVYHKFTKQESNSVLNCVQFTYDIGHRLLNSVKNSELIYEFIFLSLSKNHMITNYIIFDCGSLAVRNCIDSLRETFFLEEHNEDLSYAHLNTLFVYLNNASLVIENSTKINNRLENILNQYISENLSDANLRDFSQLINYSYEQASLIIKETTGFTFSELLLKKKISKVRDLLINTKLSILEISQVTNIGNRTYFNQKFKCDTGYSMGEFRKIYRS